MQVIDRLENIDAIAYSSDYIGAISNICEFMQCDAS